MPDLSTYNWNQLSPGTAPSARQGHAMVWVGDRVVLFGGLVGGVYSDETWEYASNVWTLLAPGTSPPSRAFHRMVWDGSRILMFGGSRTGTPFLGDLWEYVLSGTTWNQLSAGGGGGEPAPRFWHDMVWDGSRGLLYGGFYDSGGGTFVPNPETWEIVVNAWNQLAPANSPANLPGSGGAPFGRYAHRMGWNDSRVVLLGGRTHSNVYPTNPSYETSGNTWVYESADWSQPGPATQPGERYTHALAVTDDDGKVIIYGGDVSPTGSLGEIVVDETWAYDDIDWTDLAPAANPGKIIRSDMVWDTILSRAILFGGERYSAPTSHASIAETWEFAGPAPPPGNVASLRHTFGLA